MLKVLQLLLRLEGPRLGSLLPIGLYSLLRRLGLIGGVLLFLRDHESPKEKADSLS